jgi:hypothetical protein
MFKKKPHFPKLARDERGVAYCAPRDPSPPSPPSHDTARLQQAAAGGDPTAKLIYSTLADRELPDGTLPKD